MLNYTIRKASVPPEVSASPQAAGWSVADGAEVVSFHPQSSDHRPITRAMVLYDPDNIYVRFSVMDRYVRCIRTEYQSQVSRDSCVEFFIQPRQDSGYFNFEINCGGTMLLYYIEDPTPGEGAIFRKYVELPAEIGHTVRIATSLPRIVDPEIQTPLTWWADFAVPRALFEAYVGPLGDLSGQIWRGNFFKCASDTTHRHWASWSPIGEALRFHQPQYFGELRFE